MPAHTKTSTTVILPIDRPLSMTISQHCAEYILSLMTVLVSLFLTLTMLIAFLGQSEAESAKTVRPHIVDAPQQTSFHKQQQHMSVQATEMSAIKFVRSVRHRPCSPSFLRYEC